MTYHVQVLQLGVGPDGKQQTTEIVAVMEIEQKHTIREFPGYFVLMDDVLDFFGEGNVFDKEGKVISRGDNLSMTDIDIELLGRVFHLNIRLYPALLDSQAAKIAIFPFHLQIPIGMSSYEREFFTELNEDYKRHIEAITESDIGLRTPFLDYNNVVTKYKHELLFHGQKWDRSVPLIEILVSECDQIKEADRIRKENRLPNAVAMLRNKFCKEK